MKISVTIPTRNGEKYLFELLKSLNQQTIEPLEIIVIDSESTDKTREICDQFSNVKVLTVKQQEFDHGGTRNKVADEAKGDYLVFLTQDAVPKDDTFLKRLISPLLEDKKVVAVYGRQVARESAKPIEKFARTFNYPDFDSYKTKEDIDKLGVKAFFFSNVCSAFRKADFINIGGFPQKTILNEDMMIAAKFLFNDYIIAYSAKATVIHSHDYSLSQQFKRYFDIGVFFKENPTISEFSKVNSEGKRFVIEACKYLFRNGKLLWVPYLFFDSIFKFIGFQLGKRYQKIPKFLITKFSMHKNYWK